jgi:hypothetical protein
MEHVDDILKAKNLRSIKKPKPVLPWQDLAAQIYEELKGVDTEKSSVFMLCKADYAGAYAAYRECKEHGKNIVYWFAIMTKKNKR